MELKTSFLRGVASGVIRAEGRIVKMGRRLGFVKAVLKDDQSKELATACSRGHCG